MLRRMTWEGGRRVEKGPGVRAGAEDKPTLKALRGPRLSQEEINQAKARTPMDKNGTLLCWGALAHLGCQNQACQRSHAGLQGRFSQLDPCVQMQLLRRGGLKGLKIETKETVNDKIKALRTGMAKDKADKVVDGKRAGSDADKGETTRAGGEKVVQFWDVPEEFLSITPAEEDMRQKIQGPDHSWLDNDEAPSRATWQKGGAKPIERGLEWAAARVALDPNATFEELVGEMVTYGVGDMAAEALERATECKAESEKGIAVSEAETSWEPGRPGRGHVRIGGGRWILGLQEKSGYVG